jgi:hypothetical protein
MEQAAPQENPRPTEPRVIEIVATARVIPEGGEPTPSAPTASATPPPASPAPPPSAGATAEAPPPPQLPPAPPPAAPARPREPGRGWAIAAHLATFADLATGVALVGVIGPFAIWLAKRGDDEFAAGHAKEALNFQLSMLLWTLLALVLVCCVVGIPLLVVVYVAKVVLAIVAATKAGQGASWRYPATVRFVR